MSNKSKKNDKFNALDSTISRNANSRSERQVAEERPLMLFSFKDFQYNKQIPPGQSYANWQKDELLAYMLEKFGYVCQKNCIEAENEGYIKVYRDKKKIDEWGFPLTSVFKNPFNNVKLDWAVVMNIGGQKPRVAGYLVGHIFYIVFLDVDHKFFPSEKKNT
jgi:hypothetical protein